MVKRVEFSKKVRAESFARDRLHYDQDSGEITWKDTGLTAGGPAKEGYRRVKIGGVTFQSHRLAWMLHKGSFPEASIDHINGIKSDNRISNLKLTTTVENGRNRAVGINSKSGVIGVCWSQRHKAWRAYIKTDGGNLHLGYFKELDAAIAARKTAEAQHGYSPYHGRKAWLGKSFLKR